MKPSFSLPNWAGTSSASATDHRDSRLCGKATPAFPTWLKSSGSNGLPIQKSDETRAAMFLWGKRRGSSCLATLIGVPKLFIGGEERRPLSPQPTVNNFARRSHRFCEQFGRRAERPAVTPRWMTNKQPVSFDESAQNFAPARCLGSRRILRCRQQHVSAIRPSLSPSQRARNLNSTQPRS